MSNTIQIKSGNNRPNDGKLLKAELGYDLGGGYLYIGDANGKTKGINLAWKTDDGTRFALRPYRPNNLLQVTLIPPGETNEKAVINITKDGLVTFPQAPLPITSGGTEATTPDGALAKLGAVPTSRTVNNKPLSSNISLTASDVGARPSSWTPSASDVGAVPTSRKVNGKALSSNISLSASDVGARPSTWTPSASDVGAVPTSRKVNGKALSSDITLSASDVKARADSWMPSATDIGGLTGSRALISNSSGKIAVSDVTSTELGYLDGVTSAIQTQFNNVTAKTDKLKYAQILAPGSAATTCSWTAGAYDFIIMQCYLDEYDSTAASCAVIPKAFLGSQYGVLISDDYFWASFLTTADSLTLNTWSGNKPRISCVYGVNIVG